MYGIISLFILYLTNTSNTLSYLQGTTRTLCAVYGPAEVKLNQEKVDRSTLDCIIKPKIGLSGILFMCYNNRNIYNNCPLMRFL